MKVLIKNTLDSRLAMVKVNIPTFVINKIIGRFVDLTPDHEVAVVINNRVSTWSVPPECFEFSPD